MRNVYWRHSRQLTDLGGGYRCAGTGSDTDHRAVASRRAGWACLTVTWVFLIKAALAVWAVISIVLAVWVPFLLCKIEDLKDALRKATAV